MNFLCKDIHIRSMEYFTLNIDIRFVTVIRTSIQEMFMVILLVTPHIFMIQAPPPPPSASGSNVRFQGILHMDSCHQMGILQF